MRYVVIRKGQVDAKATAELRARMAGERGAVTLFDRGFEDIAELKSRCKAETGLEAPAAPQFQTRLRAGKRALSALIEAPLMVRTFQMYTP
jgi:N-methylhydantoinase B